jgi:hypothetical protein
LNLRQEQTEQDRWKVEERHIRLRSCLMLLFWFSLYHVISFVPLSAVYITCRSSNIAQFAIAYQSNVAIVHSNSHSFETCDRSTALSVLIIDPSEFSVHFSTSFCRARKWCHLSLSSVYCNMIQLMLIKAKCVNEKTKYTSRIRKGRKQQLEDPIE